MIIKTTMGDLTIKLYEDTPKHREAFLSLAAQGFYNGLIFHRVIPGFIVQTGGLTKDMESKKTGRTIKNEAGHSNRRGTIAMARMNDPDSAMNQFYINLADNLFMDKNGDKAGYTVFGELVEGFDVLDAIAAVPTARAGGYENVPTTPVVVLSIEQ